MVHSAHAQIMTGWSESHSLNVI